MAALAEKSQPIDLVTLKDELVRMQSLEAVGGAADLILELHRKLTPLQALPIAAAFVHLLLSPKREPYPAFDVWKK